MVSRPDAGIVARLTQQFKNSHFFNDLLIEFNFTDYSYKKRFLI
jgi:hypothetical protein